MYWVQVRYFLAIALLLVSCSSNVSLLKVDGVSIHLAPTGTHTSHNHPADIRAQIVKKCFTTLIERYSRVQKDHDKFLRNSEKTPFFSLGDSNKIQQLCVNISKSLKKIIRWPILWSALIIIIWPKRLTMRFWNRIHRKMLI